MLLRALMTGSQQTSFVKIALLADVHSNLEALSACLAHATANQAARFAFLGDIVGYGADPRAVIDIVREYEARGAVVVKGNHEAALEKNGRGLNDVAYASCEWTREHLTDEQRKYLAALPLTVSRQDMFFVHASADSPDRWEYIESSAAARVSIEVSRATYVFSGHVHGQMLYFLTQVGKIAPFRPISGSAIPVPRHRRWLAIAGSVGQPRDGNPAAAYALFDDATEEITFYRVPYDHESASRKMRDAGLLP